MSDFTVLDAHWEAVPENPQRCSDPMAYIERVRRSRQASYWRGRAFVQRCLLVSSGLFVWAMLLALLWG